MKALSPRQLVTLGLLIGSFMGSMEATVVATAMPTIVGQLGGLNVYGWAFSIYVLASSAGIPVTGKLSDIFGRRIVYAWSMALFLIASLLCAVAPTMLWLIVFRALQGLGAAGLLPLAIIMIGDMFTFEERARVQGFFSGVWGVSSIAGPLFGGFLVDGIGWPSVFYINVPFGLLSAWLVWHYWVDQHELAKGEPYIDYPGALAVTASAVVLLLALVDVVSWHGALLLILAGGLAFIAYRIERASSDPIIPLGLFHWKLFSVAILHSIVIGWLLSGVTAYVPLFVQEVQKGSATEAGAALTPMLFSWVTSSVVCARLMLRIGYRLPAIGGMVAVIAGSALLVLMQVDSPRSLLLASMVIMGCGFGFTVPALLIAVQTTVERQNMGAATSMIQFSRSMGGSIGVGVMGAFLNWEAGRAGFAVALQRTFWVAAAVTVLGLFITLSAPALTPEEMSKRR
ncbi:MAG: MFS transporter [Bryobacterales bacterium]|nr:MFS transporter [Bryobacterales bacterium]